MPSLYTEPPPLPQRSVPTEPARTSRNRVPPQDPGISPNATFLLGIWVGVGLCAVAFAVLAITGRFGPLVRWLETTAHREERSQDEDLNGLPAAGPVARQAPKEASDGRVGPTSQLQTLTADFYPYREGMTQKWEERRFLPDGADELVYVTELTYEGNGAIRETITEFGKALQDKSRRISHSFEKDLLNRQHYWHDNGYINVRHEDEGDAESESLECLIKLGAEQGDEWEERNTVGDVKKIKLLRFEEKEFPLKGVVPGNKALVAVIEESMQVAAEGSGGSREIPLIIEQELALNYGPIGWKAWDVSDGKRTLAYRSTLLASWEKSDRSEEAVVEESPSKPELAASAPPMPGRKLTVKSGTATSPNPSSIVHELNSQLEDVAAFASDEDLIIEFGVKVDGRWPLVPNKLLVRLFDDHGNLLTHFVTSEAFTPRSDVFQPLMQRWHESEAAGATVKAIKPALLTGTGNRLVYGVSARALREAQSVEVGFVAE